MSNIDKAFDCQLAHSDFAKKLGSESTPAPPSGYPALKSSINGMGMNRAIVHGYIVSQLTDTHEIIDTRSGKKIKAGDQWFYEAQCHRLMGTKKPNFIEIRNKKARFLYAIVDGNTLLLEDNARRLGYIGAIATSPHILRLTEII